MNQLIQQLFRNNNLRTLELTTPCLTSVGEVTTLCKNHCNVEGSEEVAYSQFDGYDIISMMQQAEQQISAISRK